MNVNEKLFSSPREAISELHSITCHMGSHSVSGHLTQVNAHHLNSARQTGTRFNYPRGMKG